MKIGAIVAAAAAFAAFDVEPVPAMERGRVDCPERDVLVAELEQAGERQVAIGMKPEGIVVEIWQARNGDWTEIWTWPRGQSCVIAFGHNMAVAPRRDGA